MKIKKIETSVGDCLKIISKNLKATVYWDGSGEYISTNYCVDRLAEESGDLNSWIIELKQRIASQGKILKDLREIKKFKQKAKLRSVE